MKTQEEWQRDHDEMVVRILSQVPWERLPKDLRRDLQEARARLEVEVVTPWLH